MICQDYNAMNPTITARTLRTIDMNTIDDRTLEKILRLHDPKVLEAHSEYVRRQAARRTTTNPMKVQSSDQAANILNPLFYGLEVEEFHIILLNRAHWLIGIRMISQGGVTGTVVDPKVIFSKALEAKACGIILAHNHPSGNLRPSEADLQLTKKLKEAGRALEIHVLDHLIINKTSFYSFADEGHM